MYIKQKQSGDEDQKIKRFSLSLSLTITRWSLWLGRNQFHLSFIIDLITPWTLNDHFIVFDEWFLIPMFLWFSTILRLNIKFSTFLHYFLFCIIMQTPLAPQPCVIDETYWAIIYFFVHRICIWLYKADFEMDNAV